MKVKFLSNMGGLHHTWDVGDVDDVPAKEGARLIKAGHAEEYVEPTEPGAPAIIVGAFDKIAKARAESAAGRRKGGRVETRSGAA